LKPWKDDSEVENDDSEVENDEEEADGEDNTEEDQVTLLDPPLLSAGIGMCCHICYAHLPI